MLDTFLKIQSIEESVTDHCAGVGQGSVSMGPAVSKEIAGAIRAALGNHRRANCWTCFNNLSVEENLKLESTFTESVILLEFDALCTF